MFDERNLSPDLAAVREANAPDTLVFDTERDFETLDPEVAENLGLLVEAFDPRSYPAEWAPTDAPDVLHQFASQEFTIGMPGDGGVAWTRQTVPPAVFVKPRLADSPSSFVAFLIGEALVQAGLDRPEHFLGFFRDRYRELDAAVPLSTVDTYQLAAALYEAYLGLYTHGAFASWQRDHPELYEAWHNAGSRLEPRLSGLSREVARGQTSFAAAAELACNAVKHAIEVPAPFAALNTTAYREHEAQYAVQWAEKTFEKLIDE